MSRTLIFLSVIAVACAQNPQPRTATSPAATSPTTAKHPATNQRAAKRPTTSRTVVTVSHDSDTITKSGAGYGPLSVFHKSDETPWRQRKIEMRRNEKRKLSKKEIGQDFALLSRVVDLFLVPRTNEHRIGRKLLRDSVPGLKRLAPYSVTSVARSISGDASRMDYCSRPPNEAWHCVPYFKPPPVTQTKQPYEIDKPTAKIGRIRVNDLTDSTSARWQRFSAEVAQLSKTSAIVLDLRQAYGADPRPLMPWLRAITGRARLAPLREIRRPAQLTPYVNAYRAKYQAEPGAQRHPAVWSKFVGTAASAKRPNHKTPPIVVLLGRHCQAACELVTRVLVGYANAVVIGGIGRSGRLDRDEPAMLTLPNSQINVYFYATEYLLSKEIEAKTGPTSRWWLRHRVGPFKPDANAIALRELNQRIANPRWPASCQRYRAYRTRSQLPAKFQRKLRGMFGMRTSHTSVTIHSNFSRDTLQRLIKSCGGSPHVSHSGGNSFSLGTVANVKLLSRLAQSDIVEKIYVRYTPPPRPNSKF